MKKLLIVIDYQNDFVSGSLGFDQAVNLEEHLVSLINTYHENKDDVIDASESCPTGAIKVEE